MIRYHESFKKNGRLWIIMEYADAGIFSLNAIGDLQAQIKEAKAANSPIPEAKVPLPAIE